MNDFGNNSIAWETVLLAQLVKLKMQYIITGNKQFKIAYTVMETTINITNFINKLYGKR